MVTTAEIRAWARANNIPVGKRGTLNKAAVLAYANAHKAMSVTDTAPDSDE